jgi:hypothetical protein
MTATVTDPSDQLVTSDEEELREQALLRVRKRRDFKSHVVVYVVVNSVLWGIWAIIGLASDGGTSWPWPIFPTLLWGIGLVLNGWDAYLRRPITQAEVDEEMRRLRGMR